MRHPNQRIVTDELGTERFQVNAIVRFLLDAGKFDMNDLAAMRFDDVDRVQFAQLIGYPIGGFNELSYVHDAREDGLWKEDPSPMAEEKEPLLCAVCGKDMVNHRTGAAFIGVCISVSADQVPIGESVEDREFYQKQLGVYGCPFEANICWECWFKSLGVKVPNQQSEVSDNDG